MARAVTVVLALAIGCLLVASAPARVTVDLPRQLPDAVDREAAAEKLPCDPLADAEAADQATAIAVPDEEEGTAIAVQEERPPQKRPSLLCLVFRCGGDAEPAGAGGVAVAHGSSQERQALDGWTQPEEEKEEVHGGDKHGAYDSDSDWDSDCDSDDEDEGGIVGWFWRLADAF